MARVNDEQKDYLLSYMESHSGFAAHKFMGLDGNTQRQDQWNRLKIALNTLGPEKTVESWSRCWRDMKQAAREYNALNNKKRRKTGNNADQIIEFNELHERVLNIVGRNHGNGLALIPEIGISSRTWHDQMKCVPQCNVSANNFPLIAMASSSIASDPPAVTTPCSVIVTTASNSNKNLTENGEPGRVRAIKSESVQPLFNCEVPYDVLQPSLSKVESSSIEVDDDDDVTVIGFSPFSNVTVPTVKIIKKEKDNSMQLQDFINDTTTNAINIQNTQYQSQVILLLKRILEVVQNKNTNSCP